MFGRPIFPTTTLVCMEERCQDPHEEVQEKVGCFYLLSVSSVLCDDPSFLILWVMARMAFLSWWKDFVSLVPSANTNEA